MSCQMTRGPRLSLSGAIWRTPGGGMGGALGGGGAGLGGGGLGRDPRVGPSKLCSPRHVIRHALNHHVSSYSPFHDAGNAHHMSALGRDEHKVKNKMSFYDATSILDFSLPKLVRVPEIHVGHFARAERYNCVEPGHRIK